MDRGADAWVANTKPPFEQGLRAEGADQRDVHQGGDDPPDTEAAGEERVNLTKQALRKSFANGNRWVLRALYGLPSRTNVCCPSFWRCRYAPRPPPPVSVRPFRRRVDSVGATTSVPREARPAAKVAHPAGRG